MALALGTLGFGDLGFRRSWVWEALGAVQRPEHSVRASANSLGDHASVGRFRNAWGQFSVRCCNAAWQAVLRVTIFLTRSRRYQTQPDQTQPDQTQPDQAQLCLTPFFTHSRMNRFAIHMGTAHASSTVRTKICCTWFCCNPSGQLLVCLQSPLVIRKRRDRSVFHFLFQVVLFQVAWSIDNPAMQNASQTNLPSTFSTLQSTTA